MMDELQNIEQAVLQLLVAFRSIDGTTLATHLESLRPDFPGQAEGLSLSDIFKRLNTNLRRSSLEIKTVLLRNEQDRTSISYHCLVSTASDFVTTEFGSTFTDLEMAFVREILNMLVGSKQIGLTEIRESASEVNLPGVKASYVVDKLIDEHWLVRNEKGYFEIGVRSYLELRQYLETEAARNGLETFVLPQVLFY